MKLSFSISSTKPSSKPNSVKPSRTFDDPSTNQYDGVASKHLITEFDPSKPATNSAPKTLIPPIQNEWRPLKKMKNLHLPTAAADSEALAFEHDTTASDEPGSDMSYGLNLRSNKKLDDAEEDNNNSEEIAALQRRVPADTVMLQKLKDDLQRLPEDQGFDEFKDVPVEGFGAALLAGYGWSEGMGIGKNAKEDVKVKEIKRRTAKEGLGFVGDIPAPIKSGKDNKKEDDKKGEENKGVKEKFVRIVEGRDAGLKGSVVSKIDDDWLVLKLLSSGEHVKVKVDDVAELGSAEEEKCLRKLRELKIQDWGPKSKRGRDDSRRREAVEKRVDLSRKEERRVDVERASWLTSHIRVRVISRDLKGGLLYLKKGKVLDVVGPTTCDISMDESREIIQGVSQDVLESALPRRGGPVLVLFGKHKGVFGSLVERNLDREIAVVRNADTHELVNVKLEQVAEYTGDPSLLGL